MVARGRGGGKTPEKVMCLLQEEVSKTSQAATARATGLTLQTVQRYIKGIGEPSQATLEKLAAYFRVSVAWLRGGSVGPLERFLEGLKETGVDSITYNRTVAEKMGKECDYWGELVAGNALLNSEHPAVLCSFFPDINQYWVQTGREPTLLNRGGYVGAVETMTTVPDVNDPLLNKMIEWYQGGNPLLADYMAFCLRENEGLRKEVERLLAAKPPDRQNDKP